MKILIADNSKSFVSKLKSFFDVKKNKFDQAFSGVEVINLLKDNIYDIIILSDDLKIIDGISLIKDIREKGNTFIIIVSEDKSKYNIYAAYEAGANDYFFKYDDFKILVFKINNYMGLMDIKVINIGKISLDYQGRILYVDGNKKNLTLKEFQLLEYLIKYKGKAISREQIFEDVWKYNGAQVDDRTIDTHIKMLRNELGAYKDYIETYRGFGYKFEVK